MNSISKKILRAAEQLGFELTGEQTGSGHLVLTHPNGARCIIPATPSDWRGARNAIATLERMAGKKLPRVNHHRGRKSAKVVDPQVEAARRRHAAEYQARLEGEQRRQTEIQATEAAERRRREIEELMRP